MMMSPKNQSNKCRPVGARVAGLSLIEVLVVLVILVVGILAVIQLFPAGFGVMRGAQNSSAADRLAQQALEAMKQGGAPAGIYPSVLDTDPTVNSSVFDPTVPPDNLSTVTTIATLPSPATPGATDVNKIRYIQDEPFKISAYVAAGSGSIGTSPPPVHVLDFGPIYINDPTHPEYDVSVKSALWKPTAGNSLPDTARGWDNTINGYHPINDPTEILSAGDPSYMVDYSQGAMAVAAEPYDQDLQFSYQIGAATIACEIKLAKTGSGSSYAGGWIPIPLPTTNPPAGVTIVGLPAATPNSSWTNGSATLYRNFNYHSGAFTSTDTDPYLFNLNETYNPVTDHFSVGVLAFNPILASVQNTQGIAAKASYTAYDWHVIHEDHELPDTQNGSAGASTSFRLAINDIKEVGDVQADGTVSTGVILKESTAASQYDFLLLNLDNGALATAENHSKVNDDDSNPGATNDIHASFRNGRLILPAVVTDATGARVKHLRVYYRGTADWAVAVQRAPAQYASVTSLSGFATTAVLAPYFTNADALVPGSPNSLTLTPVTPNLYYYDSSAHTIYFPRCDVGKAITLTNTVVSIETGAQITVPTSDLDMTLPSTKVTKTYVSFDLLDQQAIKDAVATLTGGATGHTVTTTLSGVSGTSAEAIVIWRERNVWKRHTLDTILPAS